MATFGSADKPVLLAAVLAAVAGLVFLVGALGVRSPRLAPAAFLVLGSVAGAAAVTGRLTPQTGQLDERGGGGAVVRGNRGADLTAAVQDLQVFGPSAGRSAPRPLHPQCSHTLVTQGETRRTSSVRHSDEMWCGNNRVRVPVRILLV